LPGFSPHGCGLAIIDVAYKENKHYVVKQTVLSVQVRTQRVGVETLFEQDILQKLDYLRKGD